MVKDVEPKMDSLNRFLSNEALTPDDEETNSEPPLLFALHQA
jgi:hypothetical protein